MGVVALAALSILLYLARASLPFWINQRGFGPFPNRNQTGDLFGIASIVLLACGQDDFRHGRKRWILWVLALGVLIAAIILNLSRAGLAILVGGSVLWIVVVTLRQRSSARIALGISFILLLLSSILVLGGQTLERFHLHGLSGTGISVDFRWKIFHDAFELIRSSPWCGIGLGNFESAFAMFRRESLSDTRALHPESDWIWLWAELGWPAVVLAILGAVLLIRRVLPLQEGTNQRFRLAALLGAVVFAVHGLVDVSGHRVGTAYAGILLLGASLHRPLCLKPSRIAPIVFRVTGLVLLVSGLAWMIAVRKRALLPGSVGVSNVKELSPAAIRGRNFSEAISLTTRALQWASLDWQLYFSRGLAEVAAKQPEKAVEDFRRARFLEPNAFEVPLAEGNAWLSASIEQLEGYARRREKLCAASNRAAAIGGLPVCSTKQQSRMSRLVIFCKKSTHPARPRPGLSQPRLGTLFSTSSSVSWKTILICTLSLRRKNWRSLLWSERGDLEELARQVNNIRSGCNMPGSVWRNTTPARTISKRLTI
jgi:hypothetical protein